MIVDKSGKIFEDRRKKDSRRKNAVDSTGGRRGEDRRKEVQEEKSKILKKAKSK